MPRPFRSRAYYALRLSNDLTAPRRGPDAILPPGAAPRGSASRAEPIRRSSGRTTVPQGFIDGRAIGSSNGLAALEARGVLDRLLGLSGVAPAE